MRNGPDGSLQICSFAKSRRRRFLFQRLLLAASLKIKCQFLSSILLLTGRWANVSFVERKVRLEWNVRTVGRTAVATISKLSNFNKLPHSFLHPACYLYCSTAHYFSCYMPTLSGIEREIKKQERKHKIYIRCLLRQLLGRLFSTEALYNWITIKQLCFARVIPRSNTLIVLLIVV